ncbi:MAG: YdcF family protein [Luminiphilus sp.]|nr:YdcF family protein [Luminiphilus sp.]
MFTLTKILSLFVYPVSLGLWFIGLSLWGQLRGNRAAAGLYTFLALGILYFPSTQFGVNTFAAPLEARYPAFAPEELPNGDVIVVLGGGIEAEGKFGRWGDLNEAGDRVLMGAELWQAKKAPRLIVSGGNAQAPTSEAAQMRDLLVRLGVSSSAITLEEESLTTQGNAEQIAKLEGGGNQHVLLVTSSLHMRRAVALFTAQGFKVTAVPTEHRVHKYPSPVPGWMPTIEHLSTSTAAIHEWVGYWVHDKMGRFDPVEPVDSSSEQQ